MGKAAQDLSLYQGNSFSAKQSANTRNHSSRSDSLEQKLEYGSRFSRSGRNNPCPICDRTKDNKCAFKSDTIHCYCGVTNSPPNIQIGEVIQINYGSTRDWALVKKNAGFSGNHLIFIPDKPLDKLVKRSVWSTQKVSSNKLSKLFNILSELVNEALTPYIPFLNLEQLTAVSIKTNAAIERSKIVLALAKQFSHKELTNDIQLANLFETTKANLYKLTNRVEQIKQFREVCLGEEEFRDNI